MYLLYILKCNDGSLYTGITDDLEHRLQMHRDGKGSKYVRSKLPVELVYQEECGDRSTALKREMQVKQLSHHQKLQLISQ